MVKRFFFWLMRIAIRISIDEVITEILKKKLFEWRGSNLLFGARSNGSPAKKKNLSSLGMLVLSHLCRRILSISAVLSLFC